MAARRKCAFAFAEKPRRPSRRQHGMTTAAQFARRFSDALAKTARSAAGADGKLSYAEARRAIASDRVPRYLADNLVNYFEKGHGRDLRAGASVEKLAADARRYAERAAKAAAGKDGILSASDAAHLPAD